MRALQTALISAFIMLFLQVFSFRFLLGSDVISRAFQVVFFGPLLASEGVLRFVRKLGVPIPTNRSGHVPDDWALPLLVLNWVLCSLVLFALWTWAGRRRAR